MPDDDAPLQDDWTDFAREFDRDDLKEWEDNEVFQDSVLERQIDREPVLEHTAQEP